MTTDAVRGVGDPAEGLAEPEPSAPNIVKLPDGNSVTLHPEVTLPIGMAALSVIKQGGSLAVLEAGLAEVYLRFGVASWTYADPVTPENIAKRLSFAQGGLEVAEAADALYSETVMRPLAKRLAGLSLPSPTAGTTPPHSANGSTPPTLSKRSSRRHTAGTP